MMQTLTTDRLVLEPLVVAHAAAMFDVLQDTSVFAYTDGGPPGSIAELEGRYARLATRVSPDGRQRWLNWIVVEVAYGPIGYVQATIAAEGRVWVAYVVEGARRGRGFATEAMRAMLASLDDEPAVRLFMASVEVDNAASIRLLERLGFRPPHDAEAAGIALTSTERLFVRSPHPGRP